MAAALLALLASPLAHAAFGAHYSGTSPNQAQVLLYLDGGKFLGQRGVFEVLQVDIRILENRRAIKTADRCQYIYNPSNPAQNRIECARTAQGYLSGVVYQAQPPQQSHGDVQEMRCVQNCSRRAPLVLQLEVDEDNG
jgi:hypothetical protein